MLRWVEELRYRRGVIRPRFSSQCLGAYRRWKMTMLFWVGAASSSKIFQHIYILEVHVRTPQVKTIIFHRQLTLTDQCKCKCLSLLAVTLIASENRVICTGSCSILAILWILISCSLPFLDSYPATNWDARPLFFVPQDKKEFIIICQCRSQMNTCLLGSHNYFTNPFYV